MPPRVAWMASASVPVDRALAVTVNGMPSASARSTGTDADALHIAAAGIPTGVVSIPLRYMHSPVEMVQLDDVENTAKLIAAFAQKLSGDLSFLR